MSAVDPQRAIGISHAASAADYPRLTIAFEPEIADRHRANAANHANRRATATAVDRDALFGDKADGQARRLPFDPRCGFAPGTGKRRRDPTDQR